MFSPRQSASFIDSKIVSTVASACFCVTARFETRMLMRSDLSIARQWRIPEVFVNASRRPPNVPRMLRISAGASKGTGAKRYLGRSAGSLDLIGDEIGPHHALQRPGRVHVETGEDLLNPLEFNRFSRRQGQRGDL